MLKELQELRVFDRITFLSTTHKYLIDNKPTGIVSVTGLIEHYKEPFDKEKWAKIKADELGLEPEDIKESWRKNNVYSTTLGTIFHNFADNYFANKIIQHDKDWAISLVGQEDYLRIRENIPPLIEQFYSFVDDCNFYLPIKNEFVVGDIDDTKICGMLDMLVYNTKTNEFEILDFKTNKDIKTSSKFKKTFKPPIEHIEDCELTAYSLQLSLYKYFIEQYTSIRIGGCKVIWFNTKNDNYKIYTLLDMSKEAEAILNDFTKQ
jgi:hypothetical protein